MNIRYSILIIYTFLIANNSFGQEHTDISRFNLQPELKTLGQLANDNLKTHGLSRLNISYGQHLNFLELKPMSLPYLSEAQVLGVRSKHTNYGFEGLRSVGLYFKSDIGENISLMLNPYVASYFLGPHNLSPVMISAIQMDFKYRLSNIISLKAQAQYAPNAIDDDFYPSLLRPQNSFGGSVNFNFNDNLEIGAGIDLIYNGGKWAPVYSVKSIVSF
ncbi:hypothetical protein AwDysgo_06210 [Bacteroidales bacterium]|nr:hypothetical protein AwDysgo_06210 [Bacteroidales bacterium]